MLVDQVDCIGASVWHAVRLLLACFSGSPFDLHVLRRETRVIQSICRLLRELGLNPDEEEDVLDDHPRGPALFLSLLLYPRAGVTSIAILFFELGAVKSNVVSQSKMQPLHMLLSKDWSADYSEGMIELMVLLLENGADPCALTDDGQSVLNYACQFGWMKEFARAVVLCGIDASEVACESLRRERTFKDSIANSTALAEDMINGPSLEGLSQRTPLLGDRLDH